MQISSALRHLGTLLLCAAPLACTYGQVEWGGEPVEDATVSYKSCSGQVWTTQTDSQGWYGFDGHENEAEAIPDGPYLVRVDLPDNNYYRLEYVNHYFTPCPDDSGRLCDRHDIDFGWRPLPGWDTEYWRQALDEHNAITYHTFHNEICPWTQD